MALAMVCLPVLSHTEVSTQLQSLGIQADASDLHRTKLWFNLTKMVVATPRGGRAVYIPIHPSSVRAELTLDELQRAAFNVGIPVIRVRVPFSEKMAQLMVDEDDLSEFFPKEGVPPFPAEDYAEEDVRHRDIDVLINVLNIIFMGSVYEDRTMITLIGLPMALPVSMLSGEILRLIGEATRSANVNNTGVYDACPVGWLSK